MSDIANSQGFSKREILLDQDATIDRVVDKLKQAAPELKSGDILLFTFAGHGTYLGDEDFDELDLRDETLVLYDFMLIDDVLRRDVWPRFDPGVRILMVADSCNSGSVSGFAAQAATSVRKTEHLVLGDFQMSTTTEISRSATDRSRVREISETTKALHLAQYRDFYEKMLHALPDPTPPINASVLLLAACEDHESAADRPSHGVFTDALLQVWNGGNFAGNYGEFRTAIAARIPAGLTQHPVLTLIGQPNAAFLRQRPFRI